MGAKQLAYIGHGALNKNLVTFKPSAWEAATANQRQTAEKREAFLLPMLAMKKRGIYFNVATRSILTQLECGTTTPEYAALALELGKAGKFPARSAIHGWLTAYEQEGRAGLLPKHTGRVRQDYGWEAAAITIYNRPGKPSMAAVARELREEGGFDTATDKAVRTFLKALPAQLGDKSPARLGKHLYDNTQKHYVLRSTENLPVGAIYQGDGHTIDVYLEHPRNRTLWRAELTVWMDVRSRYIVGWHLSNAESAISTIHALSYTLVQHDHVPLFLYIDNGSGYKAKQMTDECTGYYQRAGIEVINALPGNAKAKGNIERWFRTMERDFNQRFGAAYCGENMAERVSAEFCAKYNAELNLLEKGKIDAMTLHLPTRDEWCAKFAEWLTHYHNRPHPEDKTTTPARLWATLEKFPLANTMAELLRPREMRTVQRGAVQHDKRLYRHPDLYAWNGRKVQVEFDLVDDRSVSIYDDSGRLICDAALASKRDYVPNSRLVEADQRRLRGQKQRIEKKLDNIIRRSGLDIEGVLHMEALEHFTDTVLLEDHTSMDDITLDIHNENYLNN